MHREHWSSAKELHFLWAIHKPIWRTYSPKEKNPEKKNAYKEVIFM